MNWSTVFLSLVFIFRINIIEHVTRLGAFSKLWHFILKFNPFQFLWSSLLSVSTFRRSEFCRQSVLICSKYYRTLSGRCPEEP